MPAYCSAVARSMEGSSRGAMRGMRLVHRDSPVPACQSETSKKLPRMTAFSAIDGASWRIRTPPHGTPEGGIRVGVQQGSGSLPELRIDPTQICGS